MVDYWVHDSVYCLTCPLLYVSNWNSLNGNGDFTWNVPEWIICNVESYRLLVGIDSLLLLRIYVMYIEKIYYPPVKQYGFVEK